MPQLDALSTIASTIPDTGTWEHVRWGPYRAGELVDCVAVWEQRPGDDTGDLLIAIFCGPQRKAALAVFLSGVQR